MSVKVLAGEFRKIANRYRRGQQGATTPLSPSHAGRRTIIDFMRAILRDPVARDSRRRRRLASFYARRSKATRLSLPLSLSLSHRGEIFHPSMDRIVPRIENDSGFISVMANRSCDK